MRNARFWVMVNGDDVKVTLKPDQVLSHVAGGPCDEGYRYEENKWVHNGQVVSWYNHIDTRDCDGGTIHNGDFVCDITALKRYEVEIDGNLLQFPEWEKINRWQRDFSA